MVDGDPDATARIVLDFQRAGRIGLDEAVLAGSKSIHQLETIIDMARGQGVRLLFTRLSAEQFGALREERKSLLDYDVVSETASLGEPHAASRPASVCIISAGATDARVSGEGARTLQYYGEAATLIDDVGVAGLWRLMERIDQIGQYPVVIAVAGMEAAMATVLGGLVQSVIIAVPTSTGYGVAEGGRTARNGLLASCSPGLTVVNIDNGYGAACAAMRVLNALHGSASDPGK